MKSPLNVWFLTPLIVLCCFYREVQADTNNYEQLKSRVKYLEEEIAILKKTQGEKKKKQNIRPEPILTDKKAREILKKGSRDNNLKKKAKNKPTKIQATRKKLTKNKITKNKQPKRKTRKSQKKTRKRITKKPTPPSKQALFPRAGKIKINLQYSLAETTGRQLNVDGFSLLPIFVVGNIESQDIVRTNHTLSLAISRSLSNDNQVSITIPYRQQSEERTNDSATVTTQTRRKSDGLGDIRVTYSQQIFKKTHQLPSLIGSVTWKSTTGKDAYENPGTLELGSGFNGIRTGVTAIKQDDPAVLFASTGYTVNMADNKGAIGDVDPGDTFDLALGIVYSLTDHLSMNFGLEQAWTTKTSVNNENVINSDPHTAALSIGAKLKISAKRSVNIRTKIGLNEATPGFQMQLSVPLKN
jgi:hypothetical protein